MEHFNPEIDCKFNDNNETRFVFYKTPVTIGHNDPSYVDSWIPCKISAKYKKITSKADYLYTDGITYCVAIGIIYKNKNKVESIALIHSASQHGFDGNPSNHFYQKLKEFLDKMPNTANIYPIIPLSTDHLDIFN